MAKLSTRPNRFYPSIPGITNDPSTYLNALIQIRESIETHERRNANYLKSFVRFEELVDLGIIDEDGNFILELGESGGGTGVTLLSELDDVTITSVNDNNFLVWDEATMQWTNQTAAEAGIPTIEEIVNILDDLDDIDLTGGQAYDLLYKNAADPSLWVPTVGAMQFDGVTLHVPSGINFFQVGDSGAFLRTSVSAGFSLDVFAQGGLFANTTDVILDEAFAIDWRSAEGNRTELLTFAPQAGFTGTPIDWEEAVQTTDQSTTSTTFVTLNDMTLSNLNIGDDYFLLFYPFVGQTGAGLEGNFYLRLQNNGVDIPNAASTNWPRLRNSLRGANTGSWGGVITCNGDITADYRCGAATSTTVMFDTSYMLAFNLSAIGASNYIYVEDTTGIANLSTAFTFEATGASATFGDGVKNWLVFVTCAYENNDSFSENEFRLSNGTTSYLLGGYEWGNTNVSTSQVAAIVLEAPASATWTVEARALDNFSLGNGVPYANILAIDLDAFTESYIAGAYNTTDPGNPNSFHTQLSETVNGGTYLGFQIANIDSDNSGIGEVIDDFNYQVDGGGDTLIRTATNSQLYLAGYAGPTEYPTTFIRYGETGTIPAASTLTAEMISTSDWFGHEVVSAHTVFLSMNSATAPKNFSVGDPGFDTIIDGAVISLEAVTRIDIPNSIGVNWDTEAGSPIEHLIFTRPATETLTTAYDGSAGGSLGAGTISFANGATIDSDLVTMADKDWSMEFWGYYVSDSSDQTFAALDLSFSGNRVFEWYWDFSTSEYVFSYSTDGTAETFFRFAGTPPSAWAHYHLRRDGANIQMYVNGVQQGGVGNIGTDVIYDIRETNPVFNTPRLFQSDDLTGVWRGFAQEFRWTMGANRGTTTPTAAFPRGPENDPLWGNVICLFSFDGTEGADANTTVDEGPNGLGLFSSNNTLEVPGVGLKFDTKRTPSETYFVGDPGYPTVIDGDSVTITTSLEVQGTANITGSAFVADDFFVSRDSNLSGDVRVGGSLNAIQGAVFDGTVTVTDDLTRLQGDAYVTDELRVYDAGGTDYISDTHDGTDATRTFFQTTNYNINGVTEVVIQDAVSVDVDALNVLDSKSIDFFSAATFLQVPTLKTAIEPGGDVYYNDVDFLMLAEGADEDTTYTSDDAGARTATFVANAKLDNAVTPKYNATTTLLLDGANSYVTFPDSADWVLGTDDFTMEAWVQSAASNPSGTILSQWNSATNDNRAFQFRLNGGFGWIVFDYRDTSGNQVTLNGTGFQGTWGANTWYHICIQRDTANDALYYYRDGVRGGTLTLDGTRSIRDSASPLAVGIGDQNFLSGDYTGNLEGIRLTKGRIRYPTAGFTPPTAAMETQQADILFEVGDDAGALPTDIYGKDINLLADTYIRNNAPRLVFWDEDATADEQVWLLSNIGDEFKLETAADATPTTGVESALTIARTGTAIDTMTFANGEAIFSDTLRVPVYDDAGRPAAGTAGRVIFNTTDGQLNIDDGTNWTLPDGTTT